MDPPTLVLRRPDSRAPIVDVPDDGDLDRTERARRDAVREGFVTSPADASLLRIDDVEGADAARQFLSETDFDAEFVFLDRWGVRQCYERTLCHVTWSDYELRVTYARHYRDYDVACDTDTRDRVARFVRLDGTVDTGKIEHGGTAIHSGACPPPRWRRGRETTTATATDTAASARFGGWW